MRHRSPAGIGCICIPLVTAAQVGCAPSPISGRRILDDLQRDGISLPEESENRPSTQLEAQELPSSGITLRDLFLAAEQRNPDLAVARSEVGVAAGELWQAGLYPNPSGEVKVEDFGFREEWGSTDTTVGVVQPIVIGGRLSKAIEAASAERAARLAALESTRREVFGRIVELHARVIELRDQEGLLNDLIEVARQTLSTAQTRFEARAAIEPDVIRPRVEVYRLEAELKRVAREREAAEVELGLLIDDDPIRAPRLTGTVSLTPPPLDAEALSEAVRTSHPDLIVADREIDAAAARIEQIEAERIPDLEIGVGVGYSEGSDQGIVTAGAGMRIPLWDRRQGDLLSSRFDLRRIRQDRLARENELLAALANAYGDYEAARGELGTLRDDLVPDAQRAFDQISEAYRAGRTSFLDMLDAQRTLVEARRAMVELAGRASRARARLGGIAGVELLINQDGIDGPPEPIPTKPHEAPDGAEDVP